MATPDPRIVANPKLLNLHSVAAELGCSVDTVDRYIRRGDLPVVTLPSRPPSVSSRRSLIAASRIGGKLSEHAGARPDRNLRLTPASAIKPRPVRWLWDGRIALGTINLLGGREGIGKSILECTLAADITRGRLPGIYWGTPQAVIFAATEDSCGIHHLPRLMAADADLALVFRVDVETSTGTDATISLPRDLSAVERLILEQRAVVMMLDPILSRLDAELDSHKDGEVRQALEPLVAVADRTGCSVLGLIHVNKSTSSDPLTTLMASRAFVAVARAVLFVMVDPEDETTRLLGNRRITLGAPTFPRSLSRSRRPRWTTPQRGPSRPASCTGPVRLIARLARR